MKKQRNKSLSILLCILIVISILPFAGISAFANEGKITDGNYTYIIENEEAHIVAVDNSISGNIVIPDYLGNYPVTSIRYEAFYDINTITSVIFPKYLKYIGGRAFNSCNNLKQITFNDTLEEIDYSSFNMCTSLTKITIPDSVNYIGYAAFGGCVSLNEITLPQHGNLIFGDPDAFYDTAHQNNLNNWINGYWYVDNYLMDINEETKLNITGELSFDNNVVFIHPAAVSYIENLETLILPDSIKVMPQIVGNQNLKKVIIGSGITSTYYGGNLPTFVDCPNLNEVIFPKSVSTIGAHLFEDANPTKITILNPSAQIGIYEGKVFPDAVPEDCVIYGFKGSTAEEYANLYNKKFIAIECEDEHNFGEWSESLAPTCTEKGVEERICDTCKKAETREISPLGHSFGEWYTDSDPTCIADGTERRDCFCGETETRSIPLIPDNHIDEDENNFCDNCGISLSDDDDIKEECSHLCHHTNAFTKFIWKIVQFFWKLFSINPTCSCGEAHY